MIWRTLLPIAAVFFALIFGVYHLWSANATLKSDNATLTKQRDDAKGETATLRNQYNTINEALNNAAEQKRQSDEATKMLKDRLTELQKSSVCNREPVSDAVSDQLRQRVAEVNSTVADTTNVVH
ncbi:hypothetical protein [Limnobaculum xujianqingii]|uniref:hypothetical protein n=1 Tax=Limnobaculum xujianqingii TaxID=2738837 RepID=UPI00112626A1|nr:hypothetical protein [Limnobaculum xujianqingii]